MRGNDMSDAEIIAFPGASGRKAPAGGSQRPLRAHPDTAEGDAAPASDGSAVHATVSALSEHIASLQRSGMPRSASNGDHGGEDQHDVQTVQAPTTSLPWSAASGQTPLPGEERALSLLRRSDKTRAELAARLREDEELSEEAREAVLDRMEEYGYLSDARVADAIVDKLLRRQGKGRMLVERELRHRGISEHIIEASLEDCDRDDEFLRAEAAALERARKLRGVDDVTAHRRLVSYLQRRGFTSGVALRAAEQALQRHPSGGRPTTSGVFFEPSMD